MHLFRLEGIKLDLSIDNRGIDYHVTQLKDVSRGQLLWYLSVSIYQYSHWSVWLFVAVVMEEHWYGAIGGMYDERNGFVDVQM